MKSKLTSSKLTRLVNMKRFQAFTPLLVVGLLVLTGAVIYQLSSHAATAGFTLSSGAASYKIGDTFDVAVYENSNSDCANVVEANLTYPSNMLRYNTTSLSGSKFESAAPTNSSGNGRVYITQYTTRKECGSGASATSGIAGSQLIATISFTVIGAGTAPVNFDTSTTRAVSAADNKSNVASGASGKSYTLASVPTPSPTPTPLPTPTPSPTPSPTSNPSPAPNPSPINSTPRTSTTRPSTPVTSVTPVGNDTPVALVDNDTVEVTTPVDINPTPIQPDGVSMIEYYLNGNKVATVKTSPYTYKLDTQNLLNGTYKLTQKTYYSNGQTKSTTQNVVVKNAFGFKQFSLWLKKFAWLVILILLVIAAVVIAWAIHRRKGGPDNYYGDTDYASDQNYTVGSQGNGQPSASGMNSVAPGDQILPAPAPQPAPYNSPNNPATIGVDPTLITPTDQSSETVFRPNVR